MRSQRVHRVGLGLAVGLLALAAGAAPSRADDGSPLDGVRELVADLRFEEAAERIPEVLDAGGLTAAETAAAYRLGGEVLASMGDADGARDYFERWLVLDPDGRLADGVSPKLAEPYERARARVEESGALRVRPHVTRSGRAVRVEVVVEADPLEMVSGVRVALDIDRVEHSDELALDLEVDSADAVRMTVTVTDGRGNALAELEARAPAAAVAAAVGSSARTGRPRPWYARWYTWAGVAGVSAGAGAFFGLRARSDADELETLNAASSMHSYAEARDIERRGKRNALLANVSFGVAGAAAVAAVIFGVRGAREEPTATIEPMVGGDVAGLSWRVSF